MVNCEDEEEDGVGEGVDEGVGVGVGSAVAVKFIPDADLKLVPLPQVPSVFFKQALE